MDLPHYARCAHARTTDPVPLALRLRPPKTTRRHPAGDCASSEGDCTVLQPTSHKSCKNNQRAGERHNAGIGCFSVGSRVQVNNKIGEGHGDHARDGRSAPQAGLRALGGNLGGDQDPHTELSYDATMNRRYPRSRSFSRQHQDVPRAPTRPAPRF